MVERTGGLGEAVTASLWHGHPPATWQDRWGVPVLRVYERVGSTSDVARRLAEEGSPTGAVVLADAQTRGRGRRGRSWLDSPGCSLLLSIVLRPDDLQPPAVTDPPTAVDPLSALPIRAALGVAQAVKQVADLDLMLKWPNDLLVRGRKVGGVLCEGATEGGRRSYVVVGIGLNVLQQPGDWPAELTGRVTSLRAEIGRDVPLPTLAGPVISTVLEITRAAGPLDPHLLSDARARDTLNGHRLTVDGRDAGTGAGIDADGALLVERDGATHRIISGTVRVADTGTHHGET